MRLANSHTVGSPTIRALATMVAALLVTLAMTLAGVAGKNLLAADGTIVVDPAGNGDYTTITEAVAAAVDGDTVLLKAGRYPESVTVTKAITIRGEEPGTAVIEVALGCITDQEAWETTCPSGVPLYRDESPYGFVLEGADVTVSDIHFHFGALAEGIVVEGGSVSLEGLSTTAADLGGLGVPTDASAHVSITDSDLGMGWVAPTGGSQVTIEGSAFGGFYTDGAADGEQHTIRNSQVRGQIYFTGPILIEGNDFPPSSERWEYDPLIRAEGGEGWAIKDNTLRGSQSHIAAVQVMAAAGPGVIEGNTLIGNDTGIDVGNDSIVEGNVISEGRYGIEVTSGAPQLVGNTVDGMSTHGIAVVFAQPVLTGNQACGNGVDLFLGLKAEPEIDESNDICVTESTD